jgi:hypothetical protein
MCFKGEAQPSEGLWFARDQRTREPCVPGPQRPAASSARCTHWARAPPRGRSGDCGRRPIGKEPEAPCRAREDRQEFAKSSGSCGPLGPFPGSGSLAPLSSFTPRPPAHFFCAPTTVSELTWNSGSSAGGRRKPTLPPQCLFAPATYTSEASQLELVHAGVGTGVYSLSLWPWSWLSGDHSPGARKPVSLTEKRVWPSSSRKVPSSSSC